MKRATRELMWTVPQPTEGKASHYAWDGSSPKSLAFEPWAIQWTAGYDTAFLMVPDRRAGVVVLANLDNVNTNAWRRDSEIVLDLHEAPSKN